MSLEALLQAQWSDYADRHRDRVNLLIHIVAVPLFWIGTISAASALLFEGLVHALGDIALMALALFAQGLGNDREAIPAPPAKDAWDAIRRVAVEQFVTFPRFVISGGWWRNLNSAG
ncbi:MAG: terminase [Pseudomonadota bacterium]